MVLIIDNNDIKSNKTIKKPKYNQGNTIEKFEEALKKKLKAKYCVTTLAELVQHLITII